MRTSSDNGDFARTPADIGADTGLNRPLGAFAASKVLASDIENPSIVLIEQRVFARDCLARCLKSATGQNVVAYASVEEWLEDADTVCGSLVVICISGDIKGTLAQRELALLPRVAQRLPTVVLSDFDDVDHVVDVLSRGAQGCIPTSLAFDVAVEALRLVRAGGAFVPAGSLMAARRTAEIGGNSRQTAVSMFTARETAVVHALRRGRANKMIAHELNMRESTVKVHVRHIMKKLGAKNRTEVALMAAGILDAK
jgi:DNA-binding NarL/FixJ family response regulator